MGKTCTKCKNIVKERAIECPYCGSKSFFNEKTENEGLPDVSTRNKNVDENTELDSTDNNKKNGIYSDNLEQLINSALSDGELSEKEKKVIYKRAEQEGVDLDELDIIIESKINNLHKHQIQSKKTQNDVKSSKSYLNELIDLALEDGVVTTKERDTLFKKANELGVDEDEFELILEGKITKFQKEGVKEPKQNNVIKCPSCNDIIPALSRVCPSCDFVLDSKKQTSNSEKGLEELIEEIEDNLVWIKSLPTKSIFNSLAKHSFISFPIFSIVLITLGFRFTIQSPLFLLTLLVTLFLIIINIIIIRKKLKSGGSASEDYNKHKALFEKQSRTANTLYGENKKVKLLLSNLEAELTNIDIARSKQKKIEYISYFIIFSALIGLMFLPSQKSEKEIIKAKESADKELLLQADEFIYNNQLNEAKEILHELKAETSIVLVKSKIQLSKLSTQLEDLELFIEKKEYSKVNLELQKIIWQKISNSWDEEKIERDVFKTFIKRKTAINNQLPEEYQIEVEGIYSL